MSRLPVPGGDVGSWGAVLNDYLSVEHNGDGTLKNVARPSEVNEKASTLRTTTTKTTAYTASADELVLCNAAAGSFTVTLPLASTAGQQVVVKKLDSSGNAITIVPQGSNVINSAASSSVISLQDEAVSLISDGAGKWIEDADRKPLSALDSRYDSRYAHSMGWIVVTDTQWGNAPFGANGVAACAAATKGQTVYFPTGTYTPPSGRDNGYTIKADGVTVMFGPGVTINVTTWGACGLDLIDRSDITVTGRPTITFTGTRGTHVSIPSYRGSAGYVNGCGVFANRDRIRIHGLRTIGMPLGVFLSSWNGTSSIDRVGVGNIIEDLECEGANFGILWVGQKGLRINNLYVHDDIDDSLGANPTHAYYSSAAAGMHCTDIIISNVFAENIFNGQAFQLKFSDNVRLSNHLARNCKGLFNGMDITDLTSDGMGITNSLENIGVGSLTFQSTNKRVKMNNTFITMAANQNDRAVSIIADDSEFNSLTVTSSRPSGASTSQYEVVIRGNNNRYSGLTVRSRGAVHCWPLTIGYSGIACNNLLLEDFVFESTRGFGYVLDGNAGIVIKYDPGAQKDIIDGVYLTTTSGGAADYSITRGEYERIYTANASNASPRPNPYLETRSVIAITDASAIAIGAPKGANPPTGTIQEIIINNQTAGSLGAITWNAVYVLATTYTAPGAGASTFHRFRFNGTNWNEVTQSVAGQSGGGTPPNIQTFTSSGTWTKPASARLVQVVCIAGGGGGGSGRRDAASTVRCGGGGGAGGNVSQGTYPADALPSTVAVVVGAGGTGGAAVASDTTNGNPGTVGGTSAFNVYLRAGGGAFGAGGTASTGTGGLGAINGGFASSNGGSASVTGGAGSAGANSGMGGPGGGAGGGIISASETSAAGGAGGNALAIQNVPATAGTAGGGTGASGANVVAGSAVPGAGGAGGGSNTAGAGGGGGAGGNYGAGGGGGGASTNGNASGAGGNGGPGVVQVVTYF